MRGQEILWPNTEGLTLEVGDLVLVRGRRESVAAVEDAGMVVLPELGGRDTRRRSVTLAELVVTRTSPLAGRSVRVARERALHGAAVMAVQRRGSHLRSGIADLLLRDGDTLLVQTEVEELEALRHSDDFVLIEGSETERHLTGRTPLVLAVAAGVVLLGALDVAPIAFLAVAAAVVLIVSRCLTTRNAYRALDMSTLVLMAGTLSLGEAIEKSGLAERIAGLLTGRFDEDVASGTATLAALAGVWITTNVLTCIVTNLAAAALMLPIALETAAGVGANGRPFAMAVVFAATLAYATPMGYQTNLLVYGPGGYRFSDYLRVGLPLQALHCVVCVVLIPIVFPL